MAFRYVEGDFPEGTVAEWVAGNWVLVLPKTGWLKAAERVPLRGQVKSVEIIEAHNENDFLSQVKRALSGIGVGDGAKVSPRGGALSWGTLGGIFESALGKKEVPVLCVLADGKFFLANVARKDCDWLSNQALMRQTAQRFRCADCMEAILALCALLATLDGWVDGAKRARVVRLFESDETLKTFPAAELETKFAAYCRALLSNAETGRRGALEAIGKLEGNAEQARGVVQVGVSVAGDDGVFDAAEQKIVREVCAILEIYPGEFGLFYMAGG